MLRRIVEPVPREYERVGAMRDDKKTPHRLLRGRSEQPSVESLALWLSTIMDMEDEVDPEGESMHLLYVIQRAAAADPDIRAKLDELAKLRHQVGDDSDLWQVAQSAGILRRALGGRGAVEQADQEKLENWPHIVPIVIELARSWIAKGQGDARALEAVIYQAQEAAARGEREKQRERDEKKREAGVYESLLSNVPPEPEVAAQAMLLLLRDVAIFVQNADAAVEVDEPEDARLQLKGAVRAIHAVRAGIELSWMRRGLGPAA